MTFLLDVNVLIAIMDPMHVQHDLAHAWFDRQSITSWATCPLTQNGFVRIVSHASYPNSLASPGQAVEILRKFCSSGGHVFWSDDLALDDERYFTASRMLSSGQVTDTYLLGLCAFRDGKLATLDRRLVTDAIPGGRERLHRIG